MQHARSVIQSSVQERPFHGRAIDQNRMMRGVINAILFSSVIWAAAAGLIFILR